jgi:2-keto-4-pentenoate hydratase
VSDIDPRLVAALATQFEQWRAKLRDGAKRVGWKLGVGDRERIGGEVAIGHLTSATVLAPGTAYRAPRDTDLHGDAEVALELARDVDLDADSDDAWEATGGFGVALEIVDLSSPPDDPASVVATNVFHRAVAFGPFRPTFPSGDVRARLIVNGQVVDSAVVTSDIGERLRAAERLLRAMGERLLAGDRIITGSVVQVAIGESDTVVADMAALGKVQLSIRPQRPPKRSHV